MTHAEREVNRKLRILNHAEELGNIAKTCRYFGIPRSLFYVWREAYRQHGNEGLKCKKPIPRTHPNQTPDEIVEKILYLRRKYHLGPTRIMWYMARYHLMRVSDATIYRVLKRHGVNRLPGRPGHRKSTLNAATNKFLATTFRWMLSFCYSKERTAKSSNAINIPRLMMRHGSGP